MQKAHLDLIKYALAEGCTVSVDGGGDKLDLIQSYQYEKIKGDVEACDSTVMIIYKKDRRVGWANVELEYEQLASETICDYSASPFMNARADQYY